MSNLVVGESRVFQEPDYVKVAGSACQSYATRAKIKINTAVCYLFCPYNEQTTKCIVVTCNERFPVQNPLDRIREIEKEIQKLKKERAMWSKKLSEEEKQKKESDWDKIGRSKNEKL